MKRFNGIHEKYDCNKTNWDEESLSHFMKKQISIKIQYIPNVKCKHGMKNRLPPKDHDNSISEKIHTFPYLYKCKKKHLYLFKLKKKLNSNMNHAH